MTPELVLGVPVPRGIAGILSGCWRGRCRQPRCRSDAGDRPCPVPCPAGAVRASSIFPILSVGLLFFGGLCVAASEFYKSKHNVILSAGIFFVSAGRSCPARGVGRLSGGGTAGGREETDGLWVIQGCQLLGFVSCRILGEKSSWQGKNQQRFLASGDGAGQHLRSPPGSAPRVCVRVPQPRRGIRHPQGRFWGALPSVSPRRGQALGWQHRAERLPQPDEENHS